MSNTTFTDNLVSFQGDGNEMNITGATAITSDTDGGDVNVTGGTANGLGDGGGVVITGGVGSTQGTITFSALDSTSPIPFNQTDNTDLIPSFAANSIVGALNEIKKTVAVPPIEQSVYTTIVNLNYNGNTPIDVPGIVNIITGTWLINYSVTFRTSDPTVPVAIYVRDKDNTIIDESKTFINDNGSSQRHTVTKQFIYTEIEATNELKISFQLNTGAVTTVAVEMDSMSGTTNPDQVPLIWAARLLDNFDQNAYTTITDLDYNGTTEVDVPGTITLAAGDWLIGYSVALRTPSVADDILVFVQDTGNNIVSTSRTFITKNTTTIRHSVSKAFVFTSTGSSYRITFRLNNTATVSPAVEMSALSGIADPDQVPVLWAIDLSSLDNSQNTYTTITDINYAGTTEVDVPGTMTLTNGSWIVGYTLALNAPDVSDSILVHVRDSSDNIIFVSKAFVTEASSSARHTISRSFFLSQVASNEDYKLSFRLNASADTSVAVEMSGLSGADPDQVPVLWGVRLGDVILGSTFLSLTDTPDSYIGNANQLVYIDPTETELKFSLLETGTNNDLALTLPSSLELGVANLTQLNDRLVSGEHILVQSGTFTLTDTIDIPDNIIIEGSGNEQTIFTRTGNLNMFNIGTNVTFKNCKFDGNSQEGIVLNFNNVNNSTIFGCTFENCLVDDTIDINTGSTLISVESCTFIGDTGTGIQIRDSSTNKINIAGCKFNSAVEAIRIDDSKNILISDCIFDSSNNIVLGGTHVNMINNVLDSLTGDFSITGQFITVSDCLIDNSSSSGIILTSTSSSIVIDSNIITGNDIFGINVTNANIEFIISNNVIKNNVDSGIRSIGTGTITGNDLKDNGNDVNFNIEINGNSGKVIIENNKLSFTTQTQPSLNFSVSATNNHNKVFIKNNMAVSDAFGVGAKIINPYDNSILCDSGSITVGDLVASSAGHRILLTALGGGAIINPSNFQGFTNVELDNIDSYAVLEWIGHSWKLISKSTDITDTGIIPHYMGIRVGVQGITLGTDTPVLYPSITSNSGITQDGAGVFSFNQTGFYQINSSFVYDTVTQQLMQGWIEHIDDVGGITRWSSLRSQINADSDWTPFSLLSVIKINNTSETMRVMTRVAQNANIANINITIAWLHPI